jgi:hypothetical protein
MTAQNHSRRVAGLAGLLGILLAAGLVPGASAADPTTPVSRLESPMADLAVLDPLPGASAAGTTPSLLVLDAERIEPTVARLSILRRGASWDRVAVHDVELATDDLDARWLVGLGEGRYALIATTPTTSTTVSDPGHAVVVGIEVQDQGGAPALVETGRSTIDRAVEDAGSADVDGLGSPELVLGLRAEHESEGSCATTTLDVLDAATVAVRRSIRASARLGRGVIGRFDAMAGDDLLVHAAPDCPPGVERDKSGLITIRLRDGTERKIGGVELPDEVTDVPPPLRVPLVDAEQDAAVVASSESLAVVDGSGRAARTMETGPGIPIVTGPDGRGANGAVRLAWLDPGGVHSARLRIMKDGPIETTDPQTLPVDDIGAERWQLVTAATATDITSHGVTNAWLGDLAADGCPDLVVPGAIEPCGSGELRSGATWVATRLMTVLPIEGRRTALIAAGIGWDPTVGIPTSPTPWAASPAGWWRHGPSTPFVVSETRGTDVVYFREFPVPKATIERTTARDGATTLPGFTGTRLFVTIEPLADDEDGVTTAPTRLAGLLHTKGGDTVTRVERVQVPPGNESGRDGAFTTLPLDDIRKGGSTTTSRWSVGVVPINDWGEVGEAVAGTVTRDVAGPTVRLETPFTNPVWPFLAHLDGGTEPGSTVSVDGVGSVEVDRRGRFTVATHLAPWPQTIRVTATDEAGNPTVSEFSIVGGVDYRRFPWALIAALTLLGAVAARGLRAAGRRPGGFEATSWSTGTLDEGSMPEIEELPAGAGLARKRPTVE